MKKQIFIIFGWLLSCVLTQSAFSQNQKINYESSFEKAKSLAQEKHKPLAVQITYQPFALPTNRINWLDDENIVKKFNMNFVNFKVAREDTVISGKIIRELKVNNFPSFVFLDAKGGLLFKSVVFLHNPQDIIDMTDKAIALSKEKSLVDFESQYNAGDSSREFLKDYILRRQKSNITDNADLIERYVERLSLSDLNDYAQVLFILKAGPIVDGKAYKLVLVNQYLKDSIFKTESLANRVAINNAIIGNSLSNAIKYKNRNRALATANFTADTWGKNYNEGYKRRQSTLMYYYREVKDSANYLLTASSFYDTYYMRCSVDSLRKRDQLNMEAARNAAMSHVAESNGNTGGHASAKFSYPLHESATELNNAAWNFYQFAGNKTESLFTALRWSQRAIELNPASALYDTYAHLLYRLKFYDEAESMEKKALELGESEKKDTKIYQSELLKIRKRTL